MMPLFWATRKRLSITRLRPDKSRGAHGLSLCALFLLEVTMGGYGCGGRNKTHRTVEKYPRIDSFAFYNRLRGDKYTSYKDEIRYPGSTNPLVIYRPSEGYAEVKTGNYYSTLILSTVPGIDGNSTRLYW